MSELKPCSFCGSEAGIPTNLDGTPVDYEITDCSCKNDDCLIAGYWTPIKIWQTRPIEDDLRKRIAELEAEIDIQKDQLREAKNILIDKNLQIDSLYEEGYKLQQRIAKLEELVEELKPYRDGYDGEFLEPTDDRFYLIRHTSGQLVTWRKVDNHEDINFLGWGAKGKPRRYWRLPEVQE